MAANTPDNDGAEVDFDSIVYNELWTEWEMIPSSSSSPLPRPIAALL